MAKVRVSKWSPGQSQQMITWSLFLWLSRVSVHYLLVGGKSWA
jgi:hypothetical protein